MRKRFKAITTIFLASLGFSSYGSTSANVLPPTYDLSNAEELDYFYYSKMSNNGSYIISSKFKTKDGYCYTSNDKLELKTIYKNGYSLSRVLCGNNEILEAGEQYYQFSAFVTMKKVLEIHHSLWGEDLFSGKAIIYHESSPAVNSSYVHQNDAFFIRTYDNNSYDSAYIDITVMAHEAGHKFTRELLLEDGSVFYNSMKEGIADLYAIVIHNNYLKKYQNNNDVSWLIVLGGTLDSKSGALRDVSNPRDDIPSSTVDNIEKISKANTPYQNSAPLRLLFYKMFNEVSANVENQESNIVLFNLFNIFNAASMKLNKNSSANEFIHLLMNEISESEYSHIDFTPIYLNLGWDV